MCGHNLDSAREILQSPKYCSAYCADIRVCLNHAFLKIAKFLLRVIYHLVLRFFAWVL